MAKDSVVKFCARIGPRSACLVMANCFRDGRGQDHVTSSFFRKYVLISRKRCKTQIYLQWKTNRKQDMAYQIAAMAVTLNDLEGHSPVGGLFKCNRLRRTFVQHFTRFQLTVCSHGPSALAELLV